jgi:hypothetical protein
MALRIQNGFDQVADEFVEHFAMMTEDFEDQWSAVTVVSIFYACFDGSDLILLVSTTSPFRINAERKALGFPPITSLN